MNVRVFLHNFNPHDDGESLWHVLPIKPRDNLTPITCVHLDNMEGVGHAKLRVILYRDYAVNTPKTSGSGARLSSEGGSAFTSR